MASLFASFSNIGSDVIWLLALYLLKNNLMYVLAFITTKNKGGVTTVTVFDK